MAEEGKMWVVFDESYRSGGEVFAAGEKRFVPKGFGMRVIQGGFASDPEGTVEKGTKSSEPKRVQPDDVFQKGA